jgi:SpoVK/Ycf46/Vps4 family AAA+-type ATPase
LPLGCSPDTRGAIVESLKKLACADPGDASFCGKAVRLYGAPGTGKSLLAKAAAVSAGAAFFDLSPSATDGLFTAKKGKGSPEELVAKTFALARSFQPSVVYVDDADLMFVADKKKAKALRAERGATQALDHAKAALAKEVKALKPTERIVVIGEARTPHACVKKDQKALLEFFRTRLRCPAPTYADRLALWPALLRRVAYDVAKKSAEGRRREAAAEGSSSSSSSATNTTPRLAALRSAAKATLSPKDAAILATLTEGFSQGGIRAIAQSVLTARRVELLTEGKTRHDGDALSSGEFVDRIARFERMDELEVEALRQWDATLPGADKFEPEPEPEPEPEDSKKKKK